MERMCRAQREYTFYGKVYAGQKTELLERSTDQIDESSLPQENMLSCDTNQENTTMDRGFSLPF